MKIRIGLLAAATGLALLGATAAAADGKPPAGERPVPITDPVPAGFASWDELAGVQDRLDDTADAIEAVAATTEGAGFGALVVDLRARRLRVYWKGDVPAAVSARLDGAQVLPAAYTAEELEAAANAFTERAPADLASPAARVVTVGARRDASGLDVSVDGTAEAGRELAAVTASQVPVTVTGGVTAQDKSRAVDVPAYWGGARWTSAKKAICSSGFGATRSSGVKLMLSAGHCANDGATATTGAKVPMGPIGKYPGIDVLEIRTNADGLVYNGGPGAGEFHNSVIAASLNHVGNMVCSSGAFSGTRCGIEVVAVNQKMNVGTSSHPEWRSWLVQAEQVDEKNALGNGDSGGPVFAVASDNTKVKARGIMSMGDPNTDTACTGIPADPHRTCNWRIWYTNMIPILNLFGESILTN